MAVAPGARRPARRRVPPGVAALARPQWGNSWSDSDHSLPRARPPYRPSAVYREARVRVDLAQPGVEAHVEIEPGVAAGHLDRVGVVVVAVLDAVDELGHDVPDDRRVLELVAARPDRHVVAADVGLVVDRDPVVRAVVEVDDALALVRNRQRRDAAGEAVDLRLPLLLRDVAGLAVGGPHPPAGGPRPGPRAPQGVGLRAR